MCRAAVTARRLYSGGNTRYIDKNTVRRGYLLMITVSPPCVTFRNCNVATRTFESAETVNMTMAFRWHVISLLLASEEINDTIKCVTGE